jgi:thioredoxin 1
MSESVITLNDSQFDEEILSSEVPILVDFWAEWCGPCKKLSPIVDEIAQEESHRLRVAKLNVDENPETQRRFEVMSIPTLILFRDGSPVARFVGAKPKRQLLEDLEEHL